QRKTHKGPRHDVLMMEPDRHLAHEFAATSEDHSATAQKIKLSILTQAIDLPCQPLRKADVVGIHPRDELAPRERDRLIETRRKAGGGGFTDETNARVAKSFNDCGTIIERAVVDDDHFPIAKALQ